MKKSLSSLFKKIGYLEISTLTIIISIILIDTVIAKPLCYFTDANGRTVNLGFVCKQGITPVNPATRTKTTPSQPKTDPVSKVKAPETQQNQAGTTNNSQTTNSSTTTKQGESNTGQSSPNERKIPLFNN